ncbi:MAG: peptidoglycan-binding domain-containing protein [Candidatus Omnitrophota bacterium]
MEKIFVSCLVGVVSMALVGCSTTRSGSGSSLENRVQTLESRVQALESDETASSADTTISTARSISSSSVTVETMSKKDIQTALKNAGYYDGSIDGKIGPKSRTAIMDFQKDMGLKIDGITGRQTKEKLLKYLP